MTEITTNSQDRFSDAIALLETSVRERVFPGAACGVLHRGEVVLQSAVGRFTYQDDSRPVQPDTVFDLASVTKVLATTAAAMLLYDRGILKLQTRLGDILPGFVIGSGGTGKKDVTLGMLLAHSSGLPGYAPLYERAHAPNELLRDALQLPLTAAPGERAEYSDIGFILLGKAIEVLSGDFLSRLCARQLFAPLGLDATGYCPTEALHPLIPPTEDDRVFRKKIIQGEVHDENCWALGGCAGHAGVFSNVQDVLTFARCILSNGALPDGRQLFKPSTIDHFATRQPAPSGSSRALGWDTPSNPSSSGSHFSQRSIGHLGYTGTSLWIDRDRDLAVVLLTNRTWPTRENKAIQQLRPRFHDAVLSALLA